MASTADPVLAQGEQNGEQNSTARERPDDASDDETGDDAAQPQTHQCVLKPLELLEPAPLTKQNLALFDKMTKKGGDTETDGGKSSRATSTTTVGFAVRAQKNGILDVRDSQPPQNMEDICQRLTQSRDSVSPTPSEYEDYADQARRAKNEATMVVKTSARLLKDYPPGYDTVYNQPFTNIPRGMGFNNGLSAPQPDFAEGVDMSKVLPCFVDELVPAAVLYSDDPHSLTLAHIAGEWKGPGKDLEEARMQAAYDGAALVHGRDQARQVLGHTPAEIVDGSARVMSFTTDGRQLNLFTHYAANNEDQALVYHQYPVGEHNLVETYEGFKEGRRQLRNAQDMARDESLALADALKAQWRAGRAAKMESAEKTESAETTAQQAGGHATSSPLARLTRKRKARLSDQSAQDRDTDEMDDDNTAGRSEKKNRG